MRLKKLFTILFSVPKTVYFNFRYLSFSNAVRLPVWCHWNSFLSGHGRIELDNPRFSSIRLGTASPDFPSSSFVFCLTGVLRFKGKASIGTGCEMVIRGNMTIGDCFSCSGGGKIDCKSECSFGDDVLIGHNCTFIDDDGHKIIKDEVRINERKGYHIGNHVWFGRECLILKGTETCDNIVFGARSIVSGKYEKENTIYVGSPAKAVKDNIDWEH